MVLFFVLFSGCITTEKVVSTTRPEVYTPVATNPLPVITEALLHEKIPPEEKPNPKDNMSIAVEVNYRKYVDWFMAYNLNIRAYTPEEYVCGQYTVDMINASKKAGFNVYFAAVKYVLTPAFFEAFIISTVY